MKNIQLSKTSYRLLVLFFLMCASTLIISFSCSSMSTSKDQFLGIEEMLANRNFTGAIAQIETAKDDFYKEKEKVQYYLDIGMLYHYNGEWEKSNEALTAAEYAIEELFTESMSKAALSLLLNDNAKDYGGEDYEDVYLNVVKSLNYFHLGLYNDAMVEVRRVNIKLGMLEDKYRELAAEYNKSDEAESDLNIGENTFHNSALARYMSMLLYRADGEWDDAEIDKNYLIDAFQMQSHLYNFPVPALDTYLEPSDNAKVNFICFTGRGPDKIAKTLWVHTEPNIAVVVAAEENSEFDQEMTQWSAIVLPGIQGGYHFKFQLPVINKLGSGISRVEISFSNWSKAGFNLRSARFWQISSYCIFNSLSFIANQIYLNNMRYSKSFPRINSVVLAE